MSRNDDTSRTEKVSDRSVDSTASADAGRAREGKRVVGLKSVVLLLALFAIASEIGLLFDTAHVYAGHDAGQASARQVEATAVPAPVEVATVAVVAALKHRNLHFLDESDGGVLITDAASGSVVHRIEPGAGGFTRALMRGLARDRRANGLGAEIPFTLSVRTDGRLQLVDPATHRTVELNAFGSTNAGAFASLL